MSFYRFVNGLLGCLIKIIFRIERVGLENIPLKGACLFCANHISLVDPIFLGTIKERDFYFIAKEELVKIPVLGRIIKKLNVIPIKRGAGDLGALRKSIEVLNENKVLAMFPEGTRSKDGRLKEGKDGVALIVKKTNCMVIPCAIKGKVKLFSKIKIIYGKPMDLSEYINEKDHKLITNAVMGEIRTLLES